MESKMGAGTVFRIYLPAQPHSSPAALGLSTPASLRGGHETILLVEDEPDLRDISRLLLEELGYRVLEAATGQAALEIWQEHHSRIDLLLTDVILPGGLTGRELAERLRRQKPALKVILTSGYSPEVAGRDWSDQDGMYFLQKPYPPQSLVQAVRDCLDREQQARP
ncbi:MAG: response regulator [Chloroflexi bacterium]|nr:response regulator [Chloroflexota bacterium]